MRCNIRTGPSALVLCLGAVLAGCAAQPRTQPHKKEESKPPPVATQPTPTPAPAGVN